MASFVVIGLDELFPLWAATQHSLGKLIIVAEESCKNVWLPVVLQRFENK